MNNWMPINLCTVIVNSAIFNQRGLRPTSSIILNGLRITTQSGSLFSIRPPPLSDYIELVIEREFASSRAVGTEISVPLYNDHANLFPSISKLPSYCDHMAFSRSNYIRVETKWKHQWPHYTGHRYSHNNRNGN